MTTARTAPLRSRPRLPDPPEREPDEVTSFDHLHQHGNAHYLALHFGQPEATLVAADRWIAPHPNYGTARLRRPDLLIAFDVDPELYRANNGYIVSEQGKPPDFVLEIASKSTGSVDTGDKRDDYAALGHRRVLALRRDRRIPRRAPGRRPPGRRPLRNRFSSPNRSRMYWRATAPHSTCICAGSKAASPGTTRRPGGTSRPSNQWIRPAYRPRFALTSKMRRDCMPRLACASWKLNSNVCATPSA